MTEKKIKQQAEFIKNVLYMLNQNHSLTLPPSLEDTRHNYSAGVLTALLAVHRMMHGVPVNGVIESIVTDDDLRLLIDELELTAEFNTIKNT